MYRLLSILTLAMSATALGQVADSSCVAPPRIVHRIAMRQDPMFQVATAAFDNPALHQWLLPDSYCALGVGYVDSRQNEPIDASRGDGFDYWGIDADGYLKYKSSTLWGTAAYHNGNQRGTTWNESSDADIIYPYFLADSIGGDMKMETYRFAGGYADHNDRWAWGATISYNAGLYYRNVDPRPRNTTGRLDLSAGAAMRIAATPYRAGLSLAYRKYKQSCDLQFVNELADTRVWHTTGLGTHYERFAGNGYSHYYNGNRWFISADVAATDRKGVVGSIAYSSFSFDHILTSLNKLPLQSATDRQFSATLGWLAPGSNRDWAIDAQAVIGTRKGRENIFGDPSANVYPQIGSLEMYTHDYATVAISGLYQWHLDPSTRLSVRPMVDYRHSRESYADPVRRLELNSLTPSVRLQAARNFGSMWRADVAISYGHSCPIACSALLPFDPQVPAGLQSIDRRRFDILSQAANRFEAAAEISRALNSKYALMLGASYRRENFAQSIHSNYLNISISLIF